MKPSTLRFFVLALAIALLPAGPAEARSRRSRSRSAPTRPTTNWPTTSYSPAVSDYRAPAGFSVIPPTAKPWELKPNADFYWFQSREVAPGQFEHHNILSAAVPLWVNFPDGFGGYRLYAVPAGELIVESPPGSGIHFAVKDTVREALLARYERGYRDPATRKKWEETKTLASIERILKRYRGALPNVTSAPETAPPPPPPTEPEPTPRRDHERAGGRDTTEPSHHPHALEPEPTPDTRSPMARLFGGQIAKEMPLACSDGGHTKSVVLGLVEDERDDKTKIYRGSLLPEHPEVGWTQSAREMNINDEGKFYFVQTPSPLGSAVEMYFHPEQTPPLRVVSDDATYECVIAPPKTEEPLAKATKPRPPETWRRGTDFDARIANLLEARCLNCHTSDAGPHPGPRNLPSPWLIGFTPKEPKLNGGQPEYLAKQVVRAIDSFKENSSAIAAADRCALDERSAGWEGVSAQEIAAIRELMAESRREKIKGALSDEE